MTKDDELKILADVQAGVITKAEAARQLGIPRETLRDQLRTQPSSGLERILIVPDTHAPFHDRRAWNVMLNAAEGFRPDTVIHMGDLLDCAAVSSHSKDPSRLGSLKREAATARELKVELEHLGADRLVFIEGNHEDRLPRYIADKAPELHGLLDIRTLLELGHWEFIPYKSSVKIGKVYYTHDTGGAGKYPTARALDEFKHSCVIAHHHRIEVYVKGDATGQAMVGAQFGWLGDFNAIDYMHGIKTRINWAHGFGVGYLDPKTGITQLVPVPIVDYTATLEGIQYRA